MTTRKTNDNLWKKSTALALILVFLMTSLNALAEEERTRIGDLEKDELSDEDDAALKEYYGEVFGIIGGNSRFNNIATKENIAIINVSIDGIDRRIITKLATGVVLPKISGKLLVSLLEANNATVLDYLRVLGKTIFSSITPFGERNFYGVASSEAKYVDEGFSRLSNGMANVSINPALRELISSYNVFLSAEGLTRGIYVSEKSGNYFVVKSADSRSNVGFSWMLNGVKKDSEGKLGSVYAEKLGIDITATINSENKTAAIRISGIDKILGIAAKYRNQTIGNISGNITGNETNQSNSANSSNGTGNGQGIQLITGNLVDEFGLETDIGKILSDKAAELPSAGEDAQDANDSQNNPGSDEINNDSVTGITGPNNISNEAAANETYASVLEFSVFSADEGLIVSQIAEVTGLHEDDVMKLVTFVYSDPVGAEDETIGQPSADLGFIEKVNGSVIVRLG